MERIINVVRLHLVDRRSYVFIPAAILLLTFAMNLLVFNLLRAGGVTGKPGFVGFTGGLMGPFFYLFVMAMMTINATFPFSQALSLTRREFFLGTMLFNAGFGIAAGIIVDILVAIERGTGGWGINLNFFGIPWFSDGGILAVTFSVFAAAQVLFYLGSFFATIYLRWRVNGVLVLIAGLVLVITLAATFTTIQQGWPAVGQWFAAQTNVSFMAWMLIPAALAAGGSYLIFRRTAVR